MHSVTVRDRVNPILSGSLRPQNACVDGGADGAADEIEVDSILLPSCYM